MPRIYKSQEEYAAVRLKSKIYYMKALAEKRLQAYENECNVLNYNVYCKVFGCGKSLSLNEKLFGDICINHQKINTE